MDRAGAHGEGGFFHARYRCTIQHEHGRVVRTQVVPVGWLGIAR